jgi:tetratricopeptide (TPR) repeat protein
LEKKSDYLDALLNKSEIYEATGQYNDLLKSYKEAEKIASDILQRTSNKEEDLFPTLLFKGDLLLKSGCYNEAIEECYEKILSDTNQNPSDIANALYGKARAHYNLGEYVKAIDEDLKEALKTDPTLLKDTIVRWR